MFLVLFAPSSLIRFAVRPWGKAMLACCRTLLTVEGVENIPSVPSIIMYNHQSSLDIPAFIAALPVDYKLVMKDEVMKIPFVGWVSKLAGHYFVSRRGGSSDSAQLRSMLSGICEKGYTIVMAPEGTRSRDGKLGDFRKGGFLLATRSGAPVVPMVIWGGMNIRAKNTWRINTGGKMSVKFFPAVRAADFPPGREGRSRVEEKVRSVMLSAIDSHFQNEKTS